MYLFICFSIQAVEQRDGRIKYSTSNDWWNISDSECEIDAIWLSNFIADHALGNTLTFLQLQRKGFIAACPIVNRLDVKKVLEAYLTLEFGMRASYDIIFNFYFPQNHINHEEILQSLIADSN